MTRIQLGDPSLLLLRLYRRQKLDLKAEPGTAFKLSYIRFHNPRGHLNCFVKKSPLKYVFKVYKRKYQSICFTYLIKKKTFLLTPTDELYILSDHFVHWSHQVKPLSSYVIFFPWSLILICMTHMFHLIRVYQKQRYWKKNEWSRPS